MSISQVVTGIKQIFTGKSAYEQDKAIAESTYTKYENAPVTEKGGFLPDRPTWTSGGGGGTPATAPAPEVITRSYISEGGQPVTVTQRAVQKTPAQLMRERAERLRQVRERAGTYGKDIGYAREFGLVQKQLRKEAEERLVPRTEIITEEEQRQIELQRQRKIGGIQEHIEKRQALAKKFPILRGIVEKDVALLEESKERVRKGTTYEQEYREYVSKTPLKELIGKGQYPQAVLKGYYIAGEKIAGLSEKAISKITGGKLLPDERKIVSQVVGETLLFGTFRPSMKTSGELAREILPKRNDIIFKGVSQRIEGGLVKTDLKFLTERGQTGRAIGLTEQKQITKLPSEFEMGKGKIIKTLQDVDLIAYKTIAKGKVSAGRGIKFPTGRVTAKFESFAGAEIGLSKSFGRVSFQASKGIIKSPLSKGVEFPTGRVLINTGEPSLYESAGIAVKGKGRLTYFAGGTTGQKAFGRYVGMIKDISRRKVLFEITREGAKEYQVPKLLSEKALQQVGSLVTRAVSKPIPPKVSPLIIAPSLEKVRVIKPKLILSEPKQVLRLTGRASGISKSKEKMISKAIQSDLSVEMPRQKFSSLFLTSEREKQRQQQKYVEALKEKYQQKTALKTILSEKHLQKQIQRLVQPQRYKQKQVPITQPPLVSRYAPKPFVALPKFKEKGLFRDFDIKGFDVFIIEKGKPRVIARGLTRGAALDIGAGRALKSLRATFGILPSREPSVRELRTGGEFLKYQELFREPTLKSPYRKLGQGVYVQRQKKVGRVGRGRLTFPEEISEIKEAKMKKLLNFIR